MGEGLRVTVWNEGVHEKQNEQVRALYPKGLGRQIAQFIERQPGIASVHVSELDHEEQGLTDGILDNTDVMTWWGHRAHGEVTDENVDRVWERVVHQGMGLVALHSGHHAKIFKKLMGTSCDLKWRDIGETERIWCVNPSHPIAAGLPEYIELPQTEMYGEHFDIPAPDELVYISWFAGGEVFRSGCCWRRGRGKVFYFRPGHETFPIYYNEQVLKVINNGILWAKPEGLSAVTRGNAAALEPIKPYEPKG
jgi:trehalose utilization protein